ncbi:unnamed protein product [Gongylonema pulchrum]|uniref:GOLGA2L5 domain-containing protein n=1 Tax=Gongylonema pulchrum TaxID=637853 RepID=A0A183EUE4_9BILA|nr:unnamed protein product [Gongylonema pulchrum]
MRHFTSPEDFVFQASAAAENDVTAQSESNESPTASVKNDVAPQAESDEILERKYQKDLQTALELSREMAISAASPSQETSLEMATKSNKEKEQRGAESDNVELLTADVDKEASNLLTKTGGSTTSRERQLVALYRTKLLEVLRQQKLDNDIRKKAEEEMTKYRSRYKKLCQLLNDAEGSLTVACLFS